MASSYYDYTCVDCKQPKRVTYKPKPKQLCHSCSAKLMATKMQDKNTKPKGTHKRYWYFCPSCPSVRESVAKKKTPYCGDCSRKGKKSVRLCRSHSKTGNNGGRKLGSKNKKPAQGRKKTYIPVGIDGLQKVKIPKYQIVDLNTMEAPVNKREPKEYPQLDQVRSLNMQEEFLKRMENNVR